MGVVNECYSAANRAVEEKVANCAGGVKTESIFRGLPNIRFRRHFITNGGMRTYIINDHGGGMQTLYDHMYPHQPLVPLGIVLKEVNSSSTHRSHW